jgi:signal transduction histidine kinase/CheY-like chemotaxis protein
LQLTEVTVAGNLVLAASMAVLCRRQASRGAEARAFAAWAVAYAAFAATAAVFWTFGPAHSTAASLAVAALAVTSAAGLYVGNAAISGIPVRPRFVAAVALVLFALIVAGFAVSAFAGRAVLGFSLGALIAWCGVVLLRDIPGGKVVGVLLLLRACVLLGLPFATPGFAEALVTAGFLLNLAVGVGLICLAMFQEQEAARISAVAARLLNEELKRESARARAGEKRFRDFSHAASDWFWELDAELRVSFLSDTFETSTGQPVAPCLGRPWHDEAYTIDERWRELDALFRRRETVRDFGLPRLNAAGEVRQIRLSAVPIFGEAGAFAGYRGASRDATAEIESEISNRRMRAALETLPEAVALYGPDDRLEFVNAAFVKRAGPLAEGLRIGATFEEFVRSMAYSGHVAEAVGREAEWIAARIAHHRAPRGALEIPRPGGRRVVLLEHRLDDGSTFTIYTDVTELRRNEEQLRQAQKLEAIGQLTGGLAHDFNNLLAVVLGSLEMAADSKSLDPATRRLIEAAHRAATSGAAQSRRLLSFARRQHLQPRVVDVNTLVRGMLDLVRRSIGSQIEVAAELDPGAGASLIDAGQLEAALLNLAINARDAMPDGGRLLIGTERASIDGAPFVRIAIADTGVGMAPEVAERAFEPFFTTKGEGRGSGLGLSMVYGFVKQSGGQIALDTAIGRGTAFTLLLPCAAESPAAEKPSAPAPSVQSAAVLLVDDQDDVREMCEVMLLSLGYRVAGERDPQAALARIDRGERFDLVLTDLMLPGGMSGADLLRHVERRAPAVAGVLMSGAFDGSRQALDPIVLAKPFDRARLAETLEAARAAKAAETALAERADAP